MLPMLNSYQAPRRKFEHSLLDVTLLNRSHVLDGINPVTTSNTSLVALYVVPCMCLRSFLIQKTWEARV